MSCFKSAKSTILSAAAFFLFIGMGLADHADAQGPRPSIDLNVSCQLIDGTDQFEVTTTFVNRSDDIVVEPVFCEQRITLEQRVPRTNGNGNSRAKMWEAFTSGVPVNGVTTFNLCSAGLSNDAVAVRAIAEFEVLTSGTDCSDLSKTTRVFVSRCDDDRATPEDESAIDLVPDFCAQLAN